MIKHKLAYLVRNLLKTADLTPDERDVIWQWLEQIQAVPWLAGMQIEPPEERLHNDERELLNLVDSWLTEPGRLTLPQRLHASTTNAGATRPHWAETAGAVGEGDLPETP